MRTLLFSLWLIVTSQFMQAQTRVILEADTATYGISPATLEATYLPYQKLAGTLTKAQFALINDQMISYDVARQQSVKAQGAMPKDGFAYGFSSFHRANGVADWVLVKPWGEVNPDVLKDLLKRLQTFYETTPYPAPLSARFQLKNHIGTFGRPLEKRTIRTGDSTISTLEAAIATTRPDTVKYVFFNQLNLSNVPDVLYRFPNLEELDLSKNGLSRLPARLTADLPRLQRLSVLHNQIGDDSVFVTKNDHLLALTLSGNNLTRIPDAVRNARKLQSLWMGGNKLNKLDVRPISRIKSLYDLNFYGCGLTSLPRKIRKLKQVRVLDLYYNELTTLPKQTGKMRSLEQLAVAHNKLTYLPPQLARLKNLDTLYLHHNPLSALPGTFGQLTNLRLLDLSYSQFSEFPAALTYLKRLETVDLSGNNIQVLPAAVTQLTNLKQLYLRSNPITQDNAKIGPYAKVIDQLEANRTEVFY